jgi:hypothetical protein
MQELLSFARVESGNITFSGLILTLDYLIIISRSLSSVIKFNQVSDFM